MLNRDKASKVRAVIGTLPVASRPTTPIDRSVQAVDQRASALRGCRIEQVGPDSSRGMETEYYRKKRRHQRPAAHPGHVDENADAKSRERVEQIDRADHVLPTLLRSGVRARVGSEDFVKQK